MAAALALAGRGRGRTAPNPNVGCVIVRDGRAVGRGWTQPGGRPHAEAMALEQAGKAARGATAYVTLEPCALPGRGPPCADGLIRAGVARVVAAIRDPFPAVDGAGFCALEAAGIALATGPGAVDAERSMAGFLIRQRLGRPHVTLKLATSADGRIATPPGADRWITGPAARAHGHLERTRHEAILVGRGTYDADAPRLDVRLAGLEDRSPRRLILTHGPAPAGWEAVSDPAAITALAGIDHLLIEGGAGAAEVFLAADLVDRLLWYRAPGKIGVGEDVAARLGLDRLDPARWRLTDSRTFAPDRLEIHERIR